MRLRSRTGRLGRLLLVPAIALIATACANVAPNTPPASAVASAAPTGSVGPASPIASPAPTASPSASPPAAPSAGTTSRSFPGAVFSHPLTINNEWTPLVPGTATYYVGGVSQGKRTDSHGIISIVTDLTKVIDGVQTAVIWERDFDNGVLAESELFFVAQDDGGTVWLFGEYPAIYEGGKLQGAPDTWITGVAGTKGGIFMQAAPRVGTPAYSQGLAPSVRFDDRAKVYQAGQSACVPFSCYGNVLVIDEWSPNAPGDGHQRKYYAQGVGTVVVEPAGGTQQERLSLAAVAHLGTQEMTEVRQEVLAIDAAAYVVSKAYAQTAPATPRPS